MALALVTAVTLGINVSAGYLGDLSDLEMSQIVKQLGSLGLAGSLVWDQFLSEK